MKTQFVFVWFDSTFSSCNVFSLPPWKRQDVCIPAITSLMAYTTLHIAEKVNFCERWKTLFLFHEVKIDCILYFISFMLISWSHTKNNRSYLYKSTKQQLKTTSQCMIYQDLWKKRRFYWNITCIIVQRWENVTSRKYHKTFSNTHTAWNTHECPHHTHEGQVDIVGTGT